MPEIPEVQAFAYYAKKRCVNKKISSVEVKDTKLIKKITGNAFKKGLIGQEFSSVARKGKYLIITLKPSGKQLIMHFGLTGFLVVAKQTEAFRFSQVTFNFKTDGSLHWCDVRKFGKLWLVSSADAVKGIASLVPDALSITSAKFLELASNYKTKNIKAFLMDQTIIAGIGNEYSDEILFQAGVDPHHKVEDLTTNDLKKIYTQMERVLRYAINLRKKHVKDLVQHRLFSEADSQFFKSSYLQAHRHTDMRCPKNKNHRLKKVTIAGRSAYYCPRDQQ